MDDAQRVKEAHLLHAARARQPGSFAALQQFLDPRVRRFIWHLIGYTIEEDDIVQDVFTALYVNLDRIEPAQKLSPFLFRVTRNRCYDLLRRQGRYDVVRLDSQPLADRNRAPDDQVHWSLLYARLQEAVQQLAEPQRQALILYAWESFSYEEIAEALSVPVGTVKSRLFHARKQLRSVIQLQGGHDHE